MAQQCVGVPHSLGTLECSALQFKFHGILSRSKTRFREIGTDISPQKLEVLYFLQNTKFRVSRWIDYGVTTFLSIQHERAQLELCRGHED